MRRVLLALLLVLGLGVFAALVVLSGPREIWQAARSLPFWALFLLFGLEVLGLSFWAVSWQLLLLASGVRVRLRTSWAAALAGYAVNYITPGAYLGGEPVRGWIVVRQTGAAPTGVAGTLVWDRVIAGLVLLGFALFGAGLALPFLPSDQRFLVFFGLLVLGLPIFLGALNFGFGWKWLSKIVSFFGRRWARSCQFSQKVREMEEMMSDVFLRQRGLVFGALFFQILSFLCHYVRPFFYFGLAQGRWLSWREMGVYFSLNSFLSLFLWLTPGGVGTAEGGRVGILGLLGITPAAALAFSLTYRFLELLLVGLGFAVVSWYGWGKRISRGFGLLRGLAEIGNFVVYGLILHPRVLPRFFNLRFHREDPWGYESSPYEQRKHMLMLAILPRKKDGDDPPYKRALDLGCAEGVFTRRLIEEGVAAQVVGVDFSSRALARARERSQGLPVEYREMDIGENLPEGLYDLVFCSEVLYYLGYNRLKKLPEQLAQRIKGGGHLVLVSAWPAARLFHRPFLKHPAFRLVAEHVEPHKTRPYAITCLERVQ
ncbi:MAG: flippase-like domain-containing protein [Candidatus Bipolaricaulaceae bacterium]